MTTDRPYKKAMEMTEAVAQIQALAGTQFDPMMVHALVSALKSGLLAEGGIMALTQSEDESAHPEIERLFRARSTTCRRCRKS